MLFKKMAMFTENIDDLYMTKMLESQKAMGNLQKAT